MDAVMTDFTTYLQRGRELTDQLLDRYLPPADQEPRRLHEAMRYCALAGGKRLRPTLALAGFEYCGGTITGKHPPIHLAMASLEAVHTYSLIHDDLPCMDDDDLRRGQPTCHKKYSEAVAVLAGDALHVVAFELMARTGSNAAVIELAQAVGTSGMIGGQMADMDAEGSAFTQADVERIHARKTAALIRCSVRIGAILAQTDAAKLRQLSEFGLKIGLAFQIVDDILDVEGNQALMGKRIGSDRKNIKATYPAAVGMEQAKSEVSGLINEAIAALGSGRDTVLARIARYIEERNR